MASLPVSDPAIFLSLGLLVSLSFCRQVIFISVLSSSLRQASLLDKPRQFETAGKQTANLFAQNDCKHEGRKQTKQPLS